jgi:regulatory protein YycI of two-component signal transduction system YycFG
MPKNKTKKIFLSLLILNILLGISFGLLFLYVKNQNIRASEIENEIKNEIRKQESRSIMQDDL